MAKQGSAADAAAVRKIEVGAQVALEQQKTARTFARWDAASQFLPAGFASAAAAYAGSQLAGQATSLTGIFDFSVTLSVTAVIPAGLARIVWDRSQKKRQRKRLTELESKVRELETQNAKLAEKAERDKEGQGRS